MRILIAGQSYYPEPSGQASFTVNLAEGMAQAGHPVLVITASNRGHAYHTVRNGVQVKGLTSIRASWWHPDSYIAIWPWRQVSRLFDEFRPDIVHIQDHYPLCRAVVSAARKRHLPIVGTNHFLPENVTHYVPMPTWCRPSFNRLLWWAMLDLYNRLDIVTIATETGVAILRQAGIRVPTYPVSCGIDLNRFYLDSQVDRLELRRRYGLALDRTLFLFVGRVDQEKRLDVLLQALHRLDRDDIQLGIAGHGARLKALQAMARRLNLGQRVVFTDYVPADDLPALLNSADIFAMPSEAELQSIATLEALACGRPVLAANAKALPELVEDGVNGYLFRAGDVEDAARCMAQLADQPTRWAAMGAASLEKAHLHSQHNSFRRYRELYRSLLPGHATQRAQQLSPTANQ
jgi:glycosyltransferase involved in cell wall biosynthesis